MSISKNRGHKLLFALAGLCLLATLARAQYVYTTIDDPVALANSGSTYVTSISGNVVAGYYFGPLLHGFYHTLGTTNYTTVDDPVGFKNGSSETQIFGISGNTVAGTFQNSIDDSGSYAFIFDFSKGIYTTLTVPGTVVGVSAADGVDGGNVVGTVTRTDSTVPFNAHLEGFIATPAAGGYNYSTFYYPTPASIVNEGSYSTTNWRTYTHGISGNNVVGYWVDQNLVNHGFVYNLITQNFTAVKNPAGSTNSPLYGISGNMVVGYFADPNHSFNDSGFTCNLTTGATTTLRDPLSPQNTFAQGISGNTVAGYYLDNNGVTHGFAASIPVPELFFRKTGTNLVMTATNGVPGAPCLVLQTANLALPVAEWSEMSSNTFNANGAFSITNPITPFTPASFYQLNETP